MHNLHDAALSVLTPDYQPYAALKAKIQAKTGTHGAYLALTRLVDRGLVEQRIDSIYTGRSFAKGFVSSFRLKVIP